MNLSLPIGISFYTFQSISYIIDVYRKDVNVQKSIIKLALYISLFPQLIAGPIVRYSDIESNLSSRKHSFEKFSNGVKRFIIGLSKKVLLANNLAEFCDIFIRTNEKSVIFYWIYAIAISLYIYLDFSGYSDMAIGLGKMFGFDFPENFDYPYISKSITEFWRRWHMTLSRWFKDYVYIPLGGNRVGKLKLIRNILIVWILTGLWHGASWNFAVWGLLFGVILILEKLFLIKVLEKLPNFLRRFYVLIIVVISFVIFNANNMKEAIAQIGGMFGISEELYLSETAIYYVKSYLGVIIISIIASIPLLKKILEKLKKYVKFNQFLNVVQPIVLISLLLICTGYLVDNSFNPFLYFRF